MQIQSPSRVAEEIGKFWDDGLAIGLSKYSNQISNTAEDISIGLVDSFSNAAEMSSNLIENGFDDAPQTMPVISLDSERAMTRLVSVMENQNRRVKPIDPGRYATTPGFRGTGPVSTNNYGGFNITVNANTDDPRALAEAVMEEIQIQIDRKEAALA